MKFRPNVLLYHVNRLLKSQKKLTFFIQRIINKKLFNFRKSEENSANGRIVKQLEEKVQLLQNSLNDLQSSMEQNNISLSDSEKHYKAEKVTLNAVLSFVYKNFIFCFVNEFPG